MAMAWTLRGVGLVVVCAALGVACSDDGTTTGQTSDNSAGSTGGQTTAPATDTTPGTTTMTATATDGGSATDASGSTGSPTTGVVPMCGDGAVDAGEECDDGNTDDTDACTNACKNAVCGDSIVQAMVEECDDGNMADTDMCVMGCKNAKCGDGFVLMGMEQCDDGNMSDADMCTTMCKTPTCMDMAKNGSESDVDCGGMCMAKCAAGKMCTVGADCASGFCSMNVCAVAPSCKAIKTANPMAANGVYTLDPDGNGPVMPFQAYCEMTIDGGGWTLALKADGAKATFFFDAALWTDANTFQPQFPDLDRNEAKLQSFMSVAFTDVLIGLESPIGAMGPLVLKTQKLTVAKASLAAMFMGNVYTATMIGRNAWKALQTNSSLQANCNREGFNSLPAGVGNSRARIGIVSNQEADCNSPDSYIGIGNGNIAPCGPAPARSVGNVAGCTPDNGDKNLPAFGVVFVR